MYAFRGTGKTHRTIFKTTNSTGGLTVIWTNDNDIKSTGVIYYTRVYRAYRDYKVYKMSLSLRKNNYTSMIMAGGGDTRPLKLSV